MLDRNIFYFYENVKKVEDMTDRIQYEKKGVFKRLANDEVRERMKMRKFRPYNRPFFKDYSSIFERVRERAKYDDHFNKIGTFFKNLRYITYKEVENFLLFFGATEQILADENFIMKLIFFFRLIKNNFVIHSFFYFRDIYEIYYLFTHQAVNSQFIYRITSWLNSHAHIEGELTGISVERGQLSDSMFGLYYVMEEFFSYIYDILQEYEHDNMAAVSRSQWVTFKFDQAFLKLSLDHRFFFLLFNLLQLMSENFYEILEFNLTFFKEKNFRKRRFYFVKSFLYNFFYNYDEEFLELFYSVVNLHNGDFTEELSVVYKRFRIFIVFLLRLYKKFIVFFFFFFTPNRLESLVALFLKLFNYMISKYIKYVKLGMHLSHLFTLNFLNYEMVFRRYIYKDFLYQIHRLFYQKLPNPSSLKK